MNLLFCPLNIKLNSFLCHFEHENIHYHKHAKIVKKLKKTKMEFKNNANKNLDKQAFMICSTQQICWKLQIFCNINFHYIMQTLEIATDSCILDFFIYGPNHGNYL